MERLDAIVAAAGGVILLVAVVGAALSGEAAASEYALSFALGDPEREELQRFAPAPPQASATRTLNDTDLHAVSAVVELTGAPALPPTASMHVRLVAPDGNATEEDFSVDGPGANGISASIGTIVAPLPANRSVRVATAAEAEAELAASTSTAGQGEWLVEASYSSGGPGGVTLPSVSMTISLEWVRWGASVAPAVPTPTR